MNGRVVVWSSPTSCHPTYTTTTHTASGCALDPNFVPQNGELFEARVGWLSFDGLCDACAPHLCLPTPSSLTGSMVTNIVKFHQSLPSSSPPLLSALSPPFPSAVLAPPSSRPTLPLPAAWFARVTAYLCRRFLVCTPRLRHRMAWAYRRSLTCPGASAHPFLSRPNGDAFPLLLVHLSLSHEKQPALPSLVVPVTQLCSD